jgi:hypothetical protein
MKDPIEQHDQEVLQRIRPTRRIAASNSFRERVMKAIAEENTTESSRSIWAWNHWPRWVTVACTAALLLLLLPLMPVGSSSGVSLLAQSVHAMSNLRTVHITGRIRTLPNDNFELIGAQYDFVPIEIWREYTDPPRWRVEKPGRVVVMDGQSALLYIPHANSAVKGSAVKGSTRAGFIEWLRPLLDPETILQKELADTRQGTAQAAVSESSGITTVAIRRHAQGNFANDWARNKSIPESDHTCIYRFDSATKRLQGLQIVASMAGHDVMIAEFTGFRYDEVFPQSLYTLLLPPGVDWLTDPSDKPVTVTFSGPREAAAYFFDALARESWDDALQVIPGGTVSPAVKRGYGGLRVISVGEPFQSGLYAGYFVPYEIRLRDGAVKKHKLAVRNDNPAHRWVVDGGY